MILGYWNYPGRAQHIRLLLAYSRIPFTEKVYDTANPDEWYQQDKKMMGMDFPNLPYLIDGDYKISESQNIINYIGHLIKEIVPNSEL